MIFFNDKVNILPSNLYLDNFIKNAFHEILKETSKPICVPNAIIDDKNDINMNIDIQKCLSCLCCISNKDEAKKILINLPKRENNKIETIFFSGIYDKLNFPKNFIEFFSRYEVKRISPLATNILFRISKNKDDTYFRSDPYASINIKTPFDPRDGKLDIVVFNKKEKKMLIIESKKDLKSLLNDKKRDQWNKYISEIENISKINNIKTKYLILVGGNEEELYPKGSITTQPIYDQRQRFYEYIKDKNFISLGFLYAVMHYHIFVKKIYWENIFFENDFLGLLSAGKITRKFKLERINL